MNEDNPNYIQKIIDQIIVSANLGGLPEAEEKIFRENMEAQITRRLGIIIMQNLDGAGLKEYEQLFDGEKLPDPKELQAFLEKYLPDYEEKVKAGMDEFMGEVMQAIAKN